MKTGTKQQRVARDLGLIAGAKKRFTNTKLLVEGQSCTVAQMVAPLNSRVASGNTVIAQRAALVAATKADNEQVASTATFVSALVEAVYVAFGNDPAALADFGLVPRKKPTMTPAQRIAASEKALATRKARNTMGKKQKASVTGVTAATAAAASPPVAAPAAGATAGSPPATAPATTPHS